MNETIKRLTILEMAQQTVDGARREEYGNMHASFNRIAGMWSAYLNTEISSHDVAQMMILLKVSRGRDNYHFDSVLDIAGYAYCADLLHRHSMI